MRSALVPALVVLTVFVLGFVLLAQAAAQEARSQICTFECSP